MLMIDCPTFLAISSAVMGSCFGPPPPSSSSSLCCKCAITTMTKWATEMRVPRIRAVCFGNGRQVCRLSTSRNTGTRWAGAWNGKVDPLT